MLNWDLKKNISIIAIGNTLFSSVLMGIRDVPEKYKFSPLLLIVKISSMG